MVQIILSLLFLVVSIVLIGIILVQKGKGGGLTGAFGGGGSDTFLGALQSKEIVRWTTWLAIAFISLSILRDFVPPQRVGVDVEDLMGSTVTTTTTDQGAPQAEAPAAGTTGSQPAAEPGAAAPSGGSAPAPAGNTNSAPAPAPPAGGTQ